MVIPFYLHPLTQATNGVVIVTEKKLPTVLIDSDEVSKISLVTPSTGFVYSGLGPDYRVLARRSRKQAQSYYNIYREVRTYGVTSHVSEVTIGIHPTRKVCTAEVLHSIMNMKPHGLHPLIKHLITDQSMWNILEICACMSVCTKPCYRCLWEPKIMERKNIYKLTCTLPTASQHP